MPRIRQSTVTKYLSALKQIRFNIVELGNNKMSLSGICRDLNLSKSAATEIVRGGLVKKDRKSTRLNSSHSDRSRMPSSA